MPDTFKATVITPETVLLEAQVTAAQIPIFDGMLGILSRRAPLLAKLGTGILSLQPAAAGQRAERFVISGGYVQMKGDELTVLTSQAISAVQITPQMVAAEQSRLDKLTGEDVKSMEERQAIQRRIEAMQTAQRAS